MGALVDIFMGALRTKGALVVGPALPSFMRDNILNNIVTTEQEHVREVRAALTVLARVALLYGMA